MEIKKTLFEKVNSLISNNSNYYNWNNRPLIIEISLTNGYKLIYNCKQKNYGDSLSTAVGVGDIEYSLIDADGNTCLRYTSGKLCDSLELLDNGILKEVNDDIVCEFSNGLTKYDELISGLEFSSISIKCDNSCITNLSRLLDKFLGIKLDSDGKAFHLESKVCSMFPVDNVNHFVTDDYSFLTRVSGKGIAAEYGFLIKDNDCGESTFKFSLDKDSDVCPINGNLKCDVYYNIRVSNNQLGLSGTRVEFENDDSSITIILGNLNDFYSSLNISYFDKRDGTKKDYYLRFIPFINSDEQNKDFIVDYVTYKENDIDVVTLNFVSSKYKGKLGCANIILDASCLGTLLNCSGISQGIRNVFNIINGVMPTFNEKIVSKFKWLTELLDDDNQDLHRYLSIYLEHPVNDYSQIEISLDSLREYALNYYKGVIDEISNNTSITIQARINEIKELLRNLSNESIFDDNTLDIIILYAECAINQLRERLVKKNLR